MTDPTNGTSALSASTFIASPFTVINTNDSGSGSLRAAIGNANLHPGVTINFAIPASPASPPGPASFVIMLSSALPTITAAMTIDGTTESASLNQAAVVQVNGGGGAFDGLMLGPNSSGSEITGLDIVNFGGAGIHVESSHDTITGNLLGTDSTGTTAGPGNQVGIFIDGGSNNTIGGTMGGATNTIGFNTVAGVSISGAAATGNVIVGNFIGTNSTGGNLGNPVGISISSAGNMIGGTAGVAANTIGFSTSAGVSINGAGGTGNEIIGNYIGTDASGGSLPNVIGVSLNAADNTIGGTTSAAANVIGFNVGSGISITASGNFVLGNFIGTNAAGTTTWVTPWASRSVGSTNTIGELGASQHNRFQRQAGSLRSFPATRTSISQNLYVGTNGAANDISLNAGATITSILQWWSARLMRQRRTSCCLRPAENSTTPCRRQWKSIWKTDHNQRVFQISILGNPQQQLGRPTR